MCVNKGSDVDYSLSVCDYFIRCVMTVLLGVLYYGCFNFMSAYVKWRYVYKYGKWCEVKCREVKSTISSGVCDYFIRYVLTILLGVFTVVVLT
jgi:hypothetical protein